MPDTGVVDYVANLTQMRAQDSRGMIEGQQQFNQRSTVAAAMHLATDPDANRPPDYFVNIFSINPMEHVRYRPPDFPIIRLKACPKGKPYELVFRIPNVVRSKWQSPETGEILTKGDYGERWATDLLNPGNLSFDPWQNTEGTPMDQVFGGSEDLIRRGVFWTRSAEPSAEDLQRARTRMERHFKAEVAKADQLARTPESMKDISAEMHVAAEYLGISSAWHTVTVVPEPCPNCGEPVKRGVAYHASLTGSVCVIDWQRTVEAGIKSKADVPESKRWWKEEKEPRRQ